MKLLYLSGAGGPDYQCDMLFHGLREVLGADAVDAGRLWYLYRMDVPPAIKRRLYGRGFTVYGRLPDEAVDREDLEAKIRSRFFDLVIYGSVWRNLSHLPLVLSSYPASRVAFIDGEDGPEIRQEFVGAGVYFKRECTRSAAGCLPIPFAIPRDAIRESVPPKTREVATVIPGRRETYVFDSEEAYYEDYATSIFAVTTKKAGWDCLRHYEILANGCLPYFVGLERCPSHTMISLPKRFLRRLRQWPARGVQIPAEIFEACRAYAAERLTTRRLATDFLDAMSTGKRRFVPTRLNVSLLT